MRWRDLPSFVASFAAYVYLFAFGFGNSLPEACLAAAVGTGFEITNEVLRRREARS